MNAKFERNWMGVFELHYKCPKCNCFLTSNKKEVEKGKDMCPECGNVITFPSSLPGKFDAAVKEHEKNVADKKEAKKQDKLAKKEKKKENRKKTEQFFDTPMGKFVGIVGSFIALPLVPVILYLGLMGVGKVIDWGMANRTEAQKVADHAASVSSMISSANNARYDRNFETTQSALRQNYGNATVLTQTRVGGGWVTELEGENAFGGTVRNKILTTDTGETVNLSVP